MVFWLAVLPLAACVAAALPFPRSGRSPNAAVLIGRALGLVALLAAALALALVATPVPVGLIAYAGFVPLLRGVRQLASGRFRGAAEAEPPADAHPGLAAARHTLAAGGDLLAIAAPLFATGTAEEATALAAAALAGAMAASFSRRAVMAGLEPYAQVAVGAYVLIEGGVFNWLV
jgi:cadmium resistance protein CadD (predicted permease)